MKKHETVKVCDILIPAEDINGEKWACVACDQFTSQPDYWEKLASYVGDAPSTFNLIFPEVYLGNDDAARIEKINDNMHAYLDEGIFRTIKDSFILVERDTLYEKGRLGLVMAVDLEDYDFTPFAPVAIRATEGTVVERIPPRLEIRRHAPLELPHIMLLIDDRKNTVIEPVYEKRDELELLYDTELNMGGGHLRGWRVSDTESVIKNLYNLVSEEVQLENYGRVTDFLFAVGDGNHSLATAKAHWNEVKKTLSAEEAVNHPARFALVEVENLMSPALKFEPIHRAVFNADERFIEEMKLRSYGDGKVKVFTKDAAFEINAPSDSIDAIKEIQDFIDDYVASHEGVYVDYIHGEKNLEEIVGSRGGVGILMPSPEKSDLFDFIIRRGIMPRKSFSMGEAEEKRYYFEAKKIIG